VQQEASIVELCEDVLCVLRDIGQQKLSPSAAALTHTKVLPVIAVADLKQNVE